MNTLGIYSGTGNSNENNPCSKGRMSSVFNTESTHDGDVGVTYRLLYARLWDSKKMDGVDAKAR